MPRFLLSWELGGALGHAGRLKPVAQGLMAQGHHVDMALREIVHTHAMLKDLGLHLLQAPVWMHQTMGVPNPTISLSEILMGNGYLRADTLHALVEGWRALMALTKPDVVVADYAPTATIAARTMGIPVATLSGGFSMPPDVSPLPAFRTWEPVPPGRLAHYEQQVLSVVNRVLTDHGTPTWDRLAQALQGDLPMLCTWPELDHYQRGQLPAGQSWLGPNFLPLAGKLDPTWPEGEGPQVFAYVRGTHPDHQRLLAALDQSGCRTLCYMPEVGTGQPPPVASSRIVYAEAPVNLGEALRHCQLTVCHAGEATVAQSLLAGVPLLLLPTQAEQFLMASRVQEAGAGINAASHGRPVPYEALIAQLLAPHASFRQAARSLARRYADFTHDGQVQTIVAAIAQLASAQARPKHKPDAP